MQHQPLCINTGAGNRWPSPKCLVARHCLVPASRATCLAIPSSRIIAHSTAVEASSAPAVQAKDEQPPCLNYTDVTRHNFKAVLPVMRVAIHEATFVAIDAEFTGLHAEGGGDDTLDDYDERYRRLLSSADNFVICQFGLSAFKWHAGPGSTRTGGHWEAKTFNAYIFPRPEMGWDKRFLCQASSMSYLAEQGFDFNKMIHDGIGFVPLLVRDAKVRGLREELDKTVRARELRNSDEEELVEAARRRVLSWLLGGEQELLMPLPPTRRQRTLLRLFLQDEFQLPSLGYDPFSIDFCESPDADADGSEDAAAVAGGADGSGLAASPAADGPAGAAAEAGAGVPGVGGSGAAAGEEGADVQTESRDGLSDGSDSEADAPSPGFMRLRRLDQWRPSNLIASGQQLTPRQRIEMMVEQCGFSQVLEILRDAGRPLVGHNAAYDLVYTLSQFNGVLPRTWRSYKSLLQRTFPGGLYDTKHIATQLAAAGVPVGETGLGQLYRTLTDEQWLRANVPGAGLPASMGGGVPDIRHAPGFTGYTGASMEKAHEAGFDAFMTGAAFVRLLRLAAAKAALHNGGAPAPELVTAAAATTADAGNAAAAASGNEEADSLLQPLGPYRGRVHVMRSDLPYADMYGSDPVPSRPAVLYVGGLAAQTRPSYLQQRFADMGFPLVQVCMLAAANGAGTGALVQLARADLVPRAVQVARKRFSAWNVLTFAEYYQGRQQGGTSISAAGTGTGARAAPRFIRTGTGAAAGQGQQQQRAKYGSGGGGEVGVRAQRRLEGGGGGAEEAAVAGSSAEMELVEERPQEQAVADIQERQRQQLLAFAQKAAAAAASTSGTLQARSNQRAGEGSEVSAARDVQDESTREEAVEPTGSGVAATTTNADRVPDGAGVGEAGSAASTSTASGLGADGVGLAGGKEAKSEAADAETERAAERLRSLASATQRLKSWPASGKTSGGGRGLALQRPGRPTR